MRHGQTRKATPEEIQAYYDLQAEHGAIAQTLYGYADCEGKSCAIVHLDDDPEYRYEVLSPDGYRFDGELNGMVCENLAHVRERIAESTLEVDSDPQD